ncbi:formate dehydrogenase accessory sulfurtransferase FdhD [Syntrophobotulus glycolicus]|nr:formate dehydrogenase accessory sulfurtransferase FdhD [Syntrophobotulus glycolicus]
MSEKMLKKITVAKSAKGKREDSADLVAVERPLTLFVNDFELVTMICSPDAYLELAVGFLISEGMIGSFSDIQNYICQEEEGLIRFALKMEPEKRKESFLRRNLASCCGRGSANFYFINDAREMKPLENSPEVVLLKQIELLHEMEEAAEIFRKTGGVHNAALAGDSLIVRFEDIGRHNAVDKIIGYSCLHRISLQDKSLLLSGRISSEMVIKAARAGIPAIISRAAATDLAITMAEELNILLAGFVREGKATIYTQFSRVIM